MSSKILLVAGFVLSASAQTPQFSQEQKSFCEKEFRDAKNTKIGPSVMNRSGVEANLLQSAFLSCLRKIPKTNTEAHRKIEDFEDRCRELNGGSAVHAFGDARDRYKVCVAKAVYGMVTGKDLDHPGERSPVSTPEEAGQ